MDGVYRLMATVAYIGRKRLENKLSYDLRYLGE